MLGAGKAQRVEAGGRPTSNTGRRRRAGFALMLVLLACALAALAFMWMRSSSLFTVEQAIVPVTEHVSEAQLRAALAPASGENLFTLSPEEFEKRLENLAYVKQAEVHKRFPRSLEVSLVEHEPVARVQLKGGRIWLLSEDGRVLEADRGQAADRVVIAPPESLELKAGDYLPVHLRGALQLSSDLAGSGVDVLPVPAHTLALTEEGQATLILQNAIEVRLGELNQLEEKLMVAGQLIEEYLREGRELSYVDVYLPDRPVAKAKAP